MDKSIERKRGFKRGDKVRRKSGFDTGLWQMFCENHGVKDDTLLTVTGDTEDYAYMMHFFGGYTSLSWNHFELVEDATWLRPRAAGEWNRHAMLTPEPFARKMAEFASELEGELEEWASLSDVSTQMVPGDGSGLEVGPTPNSIRDHITYLQGEWDGAEKRLGDAQRELEALGKACDTCGCRCPNTPPEAECPRCYAEILHQYAEQELDEITQWNEQTLGTGFDRFMDEAMKSLHSRFQKHEIVDVIADGLRRRDAMSICASELIGFIRINVMRHTFDGVAIEKVDEHLKPFIERMAKIERPVPTNPKRKK